MKALFATAAMMALVSGKIFDVKDFKSPETEGFRYRSPIASFLKESIDQNQWDGSSQFGATVGFTVFFLAYLYTVFAIIVDIRQRAADYDEKIGDAV